MVHAHTIDTDTAAPIKKLKPTKATNTLAQQELQQQTAPSWTREKKAHEEIVMQCSKGAHKWKDWMAVIEEKKKETIFLFIHEVYKGKVKPTLLTLITLKYSFPSYVLDDQPNKYFLSK